MTYRQAFIARWIAVAIVAAITVYLISLIPEGQCGPGVQFVRLKECR